MVDAFVGSGKPLSQPGFDKALATLGVAQPALWALLTVETRGFGYLPDRRPKILFERHVFHERTGGRFSPAHPDISNAERGGYAGGAAEYDRLARAMQLEHKVALESASWGLPQVMGYHAATLRYADVDDMVAKFVGSEDAQLDGAVRFITADRALRDALRAGQWETVARRYNGPAYAEQGYHIKLADFSARYTAGPVPSLEIRAAQACLTYLGHDPRGIDGVMGKGTRAALLAFQKAAALPETSDCDAATLAALRIAAKV